MFRYQLREIIDFGKIDYDRTRGLVYWTSYRENKRTPLQAWKWIERFEEYQERLGAWGSYQAHNLHREFGHMSRRNIRTTQKQVGGAPLSHGKSCPCVKCGDWSRVEMDEIERMMANDYVAAG